ncbi:hypothetical protein HELRODRAFT_174327 [Helobdella robusta]|uniref:Uncharacterized protein n=1 Tax=Helobdella robusta TaxID=6412 RepID=T1F806_HELRO|nr:hypothetical protein HELRODRAFT_174327 [Helobdella robusta]ESO02885.1 hypothetical protein HELRODRAFT_174327 [Helobdella robusta]
MNKHGCERCGTIHPMKQCPAFGKQCYRCLKQNHFASPSSRSSIHAVEEDINSFVIGELAIHSCTANQENCWWKELYLNGMKVRCKLDTEDGSTLRRNRRDLVYTKEDSPICAPPVDDSTDHFSPLETTQPQRLESPIHPQCNSPTDDTTQSSQESILRTRSSRSSKLPVRFKDYVLN